MCKLTVSVKLNIRSLKVTRIRQNRSRMPSRPLLQKYVGGCQNTYRFSKCTRAAGFECRKSHKPRRRQPPSSSQGKSATQRSYNLLGQTVSGSLSTLLCFAGKNKNQQKPVSSCKTTRGLRLVPLVCTGWTTRWSHCNYSFYKLNLYPL